MVMGRLQLASPCQIGDLLGYLDYFEKSCGMLRTLKPAIQYLTHSVCILH